ncbi:unnamed protein product [Peniophora sp. CBMAI 1063]|nr:unnamed protein product [Peniophora sp. CBMAI 1063]
MPFIARPTLFSDSTVGTMPITAPSPVEQAFARIWAFIVDIATSFSTWLVNTWIGSKFLEICSTVDNFTRAHPLLTGIPLVLYYGPNLIRVLVFIPWLSFQLILRGLGFGRDGVERGSLAASYESQYYTYGTGGIPHNSAFAYMQSAGARTPTWRTSLIMFIWYAIDLALGVWGFYILARYYGVVA